MSPHTDPGELLPCPFCTHPSPRIGCDGDGTIAIYCRSMGCSAQNSADTYAMAVERWNTRQAASHGSAGGDVDPADIWDAYCEEVPAERRSHQGAMAFAIDQLFSTGAQAVQGRVDLTDEVIDAALAEYWDMSPRGWHEGQRSAMRKAILTALAVPSAHRETCIDCGKREPCDDDCPNYQDQEPAANDRETRTGAHLLQMAKSLGWPDDGEGALEFMLRRAREVAFEDCGKTTSLPSTHGNTP